MIYVGVGGNVGSDDEIVGRFRAARTRLQAVRSSSLYRSAPLGMTAQALFLNAVLELEVGGWAPRALLDELLALEDELGRVRVGAGWGPRTIDLDLLMVDRLKVKEPGLTLPHPRIQQRAFVLRPLAELVGDAFVIPGTGQTVGECLAHVSAQSIDLVLSDW
jgi:2-amino-4-hydroxy-6-hydroxymethyldihydropteridine diphosphokinase